MRAKKTQPIRLLLVITDKTLSEHIVSTLIKEDLMPFHWTEVQIC